MLGYYYSYTGYDHSIPVVFLIILEFVKLPHVVVVLVYNLPISDWEIDSLTLLEHEHRFPCCIIIIQSYGKGGNPCD